MKPETRAQAQYPAMRGGHKVDTRDERGLHHRPPWYHVW